MTKTLLSLALLSLTLQGCIERSPLEPRIAADPCVAASPVQAVGFMLQDQGAALRVIRSQAEWEAYEAETWVGLQTLVALVHTQAPCDFSQDMLLIHVAQPLGCEGYNAGRFTQACYGADSVTAHFEFQEGPIAEWPTTVRLACGRYVGFGATVPRSDLPVTLQVTVLPEP